MSTFVLRLIAPRPNFAQTLTDAEREIMSSHAAHWRPYLERGDMVVFGPVLADEDSYGLAVVETDDEQALREFAAHDPVVTTGTAGFEIGRLAAGTSTFAAASVHFTPSARTAWHTHPHGQTIFVTEGVGLCQREGGAIEVIRPGDRVFFEPGENHWHGAAPNRLMTHIAIQEADENGSPVTWGQHVTDDQYNAPPAS